MEEDKLTLWNVIKVFVIYLILISAIFSFTKAIYYPPSVYNAWFLEHPYISAVASLIPLFILAFLAYLCVSMSSWELPILMKKDD
jgi:amino acid transporter